MLNVLVAFFLLGQAAPSAADDGDIIRQVIEYDTRSVFGPAGSVHLRVPFCVSTVASGYVFAVSRIDASSAEDTRARRARLGATGPGGLQWSGPEVNAAGRYIDPQMRDLEAIANAMRAIAADGEGGAQSRPVEPQWIPSPLRPCGEGDASRPLTVTAPAIRGDIGFVRVPLTCPVCGGHETIYALRRSSMGWTIVARTLLWIS